MKRIIIATGLLTVWFSGATAGTLDTVKQRGTLVCGVSAGFAGFSTPDSQGNYRGLDVDYCRALAAGVLGDANKVVLKAIQLGRDFGDTVEVKAGLTPNDQVIDSPPETLQNGDTVQLAAPPPASTAAASGR